MIKHPSDHEWFEAKRQELEQMDNKVFTGGLIAIVTLAVLWISFMFIMVNYF